MTGWRACMPLLCAMALACCDDMTDQPKQNAYRSAAVAPGPVPSGMVGHDPVAKPPQVSLALLQRGQEEFRGFCTPCHSELGDGRGMIVQRGFPQPPSYHLPRLIDAPNEHFYDVITNGHGAMYSFAARVQPQDRWAIVAYIRVLQRRERATVAELSPGQRAELERSP